MGQLRWPKTDYCKLEHTGDHEWSVIFVSGTGLMPERVPHDFIGYVDDTMAKRLESSAVYRQYLYDDTVIVRNRLARPFWWWYFRMGEMLSLWKSAVIRTLQIWELAYREPATVGRWRDIFLVGWMGKRLGLWN